MKSSVECVDERTQTYLASYIGRSDRVALLNLTREALAKNPRYLIWDPTDIMLAPIEAVSFADSPPARQELYTLLRDALSHGNLHYFIVIQKNENPYFERIEAMLAELGVAESLIFVQDQEAALNFVKSCDTYAQD
ncbi:MAG: hypothetical protein AAFQ07_14540 [Chloroflexota bacterium]